MGLGFSLGGSSGKSSSQSTTRQTVTRFDEQSKQILDSLTQFLQKSAQNPSQQYSRDNAIADTQGIVKGIFDQFSKVLLPQIAIGAQGAGVYNATGASNLANEGFAKATTDSASAVLNNITQYAQLANQDKSLNLSSLLGALQLQRDAFQTSLEKSTGSSTSKGVGFSLSGSPS